ncbi:MAG: YkgJ family cysteine cluster protein [Planctomycetes bacterium]|nr:YkgJ family cysteine cluster protein [Planctomycetota bacterium]
MAKTRKGTRTGQRKRKRKKAPSLRELCPRCNALCCRYITYQMKTPRYDVDFDEIRWFLCHEGVCVYVDEGKWHLQVSTNCKKLAPDGRCTIYENRPAVCRDHGTEEECEFTGPVDVDLCFHSPEAFERWTRENYRFV